MTWDGIAIGNPTLRRLLCDCRLRVVLHDGHGRTIGIGRRSKTVPHWLAEQVRWRDGACRFPGCENTRWLHSHHQQFWSDGGTTNLDSLVLLCGRHHRLVHEGRWHLRGHPDGKLIFTDPTGQDFPTRPAIHPTRPPRHPNTS